MWYTSSMLSATRTVGLWVFFFFFLLVFFVFSRATPTVYGGSQTRELIGAVAACLLQSHTQQFGIRAASATYSTAHGNLGSLTH